MTKSKALTEKTHQVSFIKLKLRWELEKKLVNDIQPLNKYGTGFAGFSFVYDLTAPLCKLVPKL